MLDQLTVTDFVAHVNSSFPILLGAEDFLDLELMEARTLGESRPVPPGIRQQPFSLILRGPRDRPLAQRIYPLKHPTLGTLDIFLVPLGPEGDSQGLHYQAVFN